ncbi:MAG: tetratricopeptide repeat protein [Candidatus Sulfotelmatobacter sp.]
MYSTNSDSYLRNTSLRWSFGSGVSSLVLTTVFLALLDLLLYLPALRNGFTNYDDPDYVTHNIHVSSGLTWGNFAWSFASTTSAHWHPLTWISHILDAQLYGLNPWGHHLTNVLLMTLDVALLFLFLATATGRLWRSVAVAVLFAVHPLNVEFVAWIAERKEVLSLLFMFLTLNAYLWYSKQPSVARYASAAVLFALALMSKVVVITLPCVLLLLDYWPLDRYAAKSSSGEGTRARHTFLSLVEEKVPFLLLSAAAAGITIEVQRTQHVLTTVMPLTWRVNNAIFSYAAYLWKAIYPTRLAVFYPHPENRLAVWQLGSSALALIVISALVWQFRKRKYLVVGWLWYLGTAVPTIGLLQSGRQGMADRYAGLPLIGVFVALVWLIADHVREWKIKPAVVIAGFTALIAPLILLTNRQIGYWQDSETLFRHALQVTVHNGVAENSLGVALMDKGEADAAFPHFQSAVQYNPELGDAYYNMGILLHRQNRLAEAADEYRLAIAHTSDIIEAAQAHYNLGVVYMLLGVNNLPAAKSELDEAIHLNPDEANSYIARGTLELQSRQFDDAIRDFDQANLRSPSAFTFYSLGLAQEAKGNIEKARVAYESALQLAPNMEEASKELASLP